MALSDSPAHATMGRFPAQSHLSEKTSVSRDQGFVKSSLTLQIAAMSSSDLRARMDGLEGLSKADAVYPEPLSRHNRSPIVAQQVRIPYKCGKHQKGPKRPKKGLKRANLFPDTIWLFWHNLKSCFLGTAQWRSGVQPAYVQEDGEEEAGQEGEVQDTARHVHGDQGGDGN